MRCFGKHSYFQERKRRADAWAAIDDRERFETATAAMQ
jgi:hypothetical protein